MGNTSTVVIVREVTACALRSHGLPWGGVRRGPVTAWGSRVGRPSRQNCRPTTPKAIRPEKNCYVLSMWRFLIKLLIKRGGFCC